jgi:hypothetical protein
MGLKLRIEARDGKFVSNQSTTEEMLNLLADSELGMVALSDDDDDTVRGWLIMRAQEMEPGQTIENHLGTQVCLGKSADGRAFVRDAKGEWPPLKPDLGANF